MAARKSSGRRTFFVLGFALAWAASNFNVIQERFLKLKTNVKSSKLTENAYAMLSKFNAGDDASQQRELSDGPAGVQLFDIIIPAIMPASPMMQKVKMFTVERYEKYMTAPGGLEHYPLLYYLTSNYAKMDNRTVVDIGTRFAASALAMAAGGPSVNSFDIPQSRERFEAFRGRSEADWQADIQSRGLKIKFHNLNLLDVDLKTYMDTWLISLDTFHWPYSRPFEREFFAKILEINYKGIMLLDDIHLNVEMVRWWKELKNQSLYHGFRVFDITRIGHSSGTGLLDFSGRVVMPNVSIAK